MSPVIDLNCDMGESFGMPSSPNDAELMKYITSANIACGFHSGDFSVMQQTVLLAIKNNVAIGAHPSLPDLQGFGRRTMAVSPNEVYEMMLYQMGALQAFTKANNAKLHHVKPHGALYNMAAKDLKLADAIVDSIIAFDSSLVLYGLSGSVMIQSARSKKLKYSEEVFADRTYQSDGSLTPRSQKSALIENMNDATAHVLRMVKEKKVTTLQGEDIAIEPGTICIHGDGAHAVEFAQSIHSSLKNAGVKLAAPVL